MTYSINTGASIEAVLFHLEQVGLASEAKIQLLIPLLMCDLAA